MKKYFQKIIYKDLALILNLDSLGNQEVNENSPLINISNSKFDFEFVDIPMIWISI